MQDSEIFFLTNGGKNLSGVDELNCPAEIRIPFGVTKIERRALADCPAKKIFLPDTVTQIGYEAFAGCDALEYIRFPKKIESVEPSIFRGCFSLQKVELGDELLALSENMFECCYSLEEAPFRSGILELPRNVFSECVSLKSLVIPEGVAIIRSGAAAYCQELSTVVLPVSVKIIEDDAFRNCPSLAHIRFNGENPVFFIDEDSGALFERREDGALSIIKVPVNAKQIRIPKIVTHSHSEAFQGCDSIEKVFIDCALTEHPLFVSLKTEIVDAEFIDETQIKPEEKKPKKSRAKKDEASAEKSQKVKAEEKTEEKAEKVAKKKTKKSATSEKPKTQKPKTKKQAKTETAHTVEEKNTLDKKDESAKSSTRVKKSAKSEEAQKSKAAETSEASAKKVSKPKKKAEAKDAKNTKAAKKDAVALEILEPETPEPSEPKIDDLFASVLEKPREEFSGDDIHIKNKIKKEVAEKEQDEISVVPQSEELETSEIEIAETEIEESEPSQIEEPLVEDEVAETVSEPEIAEAEESAASEVETEESEPFEIDDSENVSAENSQAQSEELETSEIEIAETEIEESEPSQIEEPLVEAESVEDEVPETVSEPEIAEAEESAASKIETEESEPFEIDDSENVSAEDSQTENEELDASEIQIEENSEQEDSSSGDMISEILEQNIVLTGAAEGKNDIIEGVTVTVEELDEAMMRGIQEEDERDYEVPEGFFPSSNSEEEQEPLPPPEPRFINGMISVSGAYEVVEEKTLYPERADEDLCQVPPNEMEDITTLIVVTQSLTSENAISQSLKNFCMDLARKHNLKRIYFFGALSLDNEEFLYGFVKFALYRNVIYAAEVAEFDSLSAEIKSFAEVAEIYSPVSPFQNVARENSLELGLPFKIFVQDNLDGAGAEQNSIQENSKETIAQTEMPASEKESEHPAQEKVRVGKGLLQRAEAALQAL